MSFSTLNTTMWVHVPTVRRRDIFKYLGDPSAEEFLEFWKSLSDSERQELCWDTDLS